MTPEPAPIDHAHVARCANTIIDLDAMNPSREDTIHTLAPLVSRAYLARSEQLETLQKNYDAAREEIMDLERRAKDDAKHLEATMDRAAKDYNALAAENARMREALNAAKLVIESDAASSLPRVLRVGLLVTIQAALDARGGAA